MTRARATKDETPQAPPPEAGVADETKPNGAADEALPSAEPGNVADLASFAEDDDDPIRQNIRRVRCSVSRPDNFTRFRTHPDKSWWRIYHFLIRDGGGSSMHFLVHPNLVALDELEGRTKRKRLIPYVTLAGGLGFWPM